MHVLVVSHDDHEVGFGGMASNRRHAGGKHEEGLAGRHCVRGSGEIGFPAMLIY